MTEFEERIIMSCHNLWAEEVPGGFNYNRDGNEGVVEHMNAVLAPWKARVVLGPSVKGQKQNCDVLFESDEDAVAFLLRWSN